MGGRVAHCSASSETSVVVEKLMNISELVAAVKPKAASNDQRPSVAAPGFAIVIIIPTRVLLSIRDLQLGPLLLPARIPFDG